MPREILEFRLVVASPSDVFEARRAVFDGVYELNRALEPQRISIRAMGWEEYVTPGIGAETQDVINRQLLRDYDILVAIFGTKLGTPTAGALSGTVEEIEHAISDTTSVMGQHRVQAYFLDRIDGTASISIDELKRVHDFRKSLEPRGVLYRLFKTEQELQQEIRVNIHRSIIEYLSRLPQRSLSTSEPQTEQPPNVQASARPDEGVGLLDLQEEGEEAIALASAAVARIGEFIDEITQATNHQTSEIEKLSLASAKEKKRSINEYATFIELRANAMKREASTARENFAIFSQAAIALAALQKQSADAQQYQNEVTVLLNSAEAMLSVLTTSRTSIEGFKSAIQRLPRITTQFDRSKRLLIEATDECIDLVNDTENRMYQIAGRT
ncbi:hypothetical protein N2603_12105 [Bradyrhizobium huanghuaihaiense]|uniref:hypothetical protein n=1 Tax=Bradyrhizobium huanghuaihaiense TaxID=990078 RepID=UPI0021AA0CA8|nr:hypothetical protein [Bradyrhizobium sp. CB3035]UWU79165.1 hypothetical protein N2603_12105 [Bradyrhizobium sp. CB3035]